MCPSAGNTFVLLRIHSLSSSTFVRSEGMALRSLMKVRSVTHFCKISSRCFSSSLKKIITCKPNYTIFSGVVSTACLLMVCIPLKRPTAYRCVISSRSLSSLSARRTKIFHIYSNSNFP